MVGTYYSAPAPGAKPYVSVGDTVSVGQVVCIVEAMKLMNEVQSEVSGRIAEVRVENGQAVEYGQELFLVAPA
jgi:acetyl-CoA carboxylase biotin carboxyl carrier protein